MIMNEEAQLQINTKINEHEHHKFIEIVSDQEMNILSQQVKEEKHNDGTVIPNVFDQIDASTGKKIEETPEEIPRALAQ